MEHWEHSDPLLELRARVEQALSKLKVEFRLGQLPGTLVSDLFHELDTELVEVKGGHHLYRPVLEPKALSKMVVLRVPRSRLREHREVMLASYLLRAHADDALREGIRNRDLRNRTSRDFADRILFGEPSKFLKRLGGVNSIVELHDGGVPLALASGYLAKISFNSSLVAKYSIIPTHEPMRVPCFTSSWTIFGSSSYSADAYINILRNLKILDPQEASPQHAYFCDENTGGEILVVSSDVATHGNDKDEALVSVNRTVVFSNLPWGAGNFVTSVH